MRKITNRAAAALAAGVFGLGGLAVAAPALADAAHSGFGTAVGSGYGMGSGSGYGLGSGSGMGSGMRSGHGLGSGSGPCSGLPVTAPKGTLTDAQKTTLASQAQQEKLAHDLYTAFAARHGLMVFDHIAAAETGHLTAVRTLLQRYGVSDPTADQPAGAFTDPAVRSAYDTLLAEGEPNPAAALAVAQRLERDDIAALTTALTGLTAPDAEQVYTGLRAAAERHLAAFTRSATR